MTVIESNNKDLRFTGKHVFTNECDKYGQNYWLTPDSVTGENAKLVIDLGDKVTIGRVGVKNQHNAGYNDRGTKAFSIWKSSTPTGPWTLVLRNKLQDARHKVNRICIHCSWN